MLRVRAGKFSDGVLRGRRGRIVEPLLNSRAARAAFGKTEREKEKDKLIVVVRASGESRGSLGSLSPDWPRYKPVLSWAWFSRAAGCIKPRKRTDRVPFSPGFTITSQPFPPFNYYLIILIAFWPWALPLSLSFSLHLFKLIRMWIPHSVPNLSFDPCEVHRSVTT